MTRNTSGRNPPRKQIYRINYYYDCFHLSVVTSHFSSLTSSPSFSWRPFPQCKHQPILRNPSLTHFPILASQNLHVFHPQVPVQFQNLIIISALISPRDASSLLELSMTRSLKAIFLPPLPTAPSIHFTSSFSFINIVL